MSNVIRPVRPDDASKLLARMRAADRQEIDAMMGPLHETVVKVSLLQSTLSWAADDSEGNLICLLGVGPVSMLTGTGRPWLLGTELLDKHLTALARLSPRFLRHILAAFPHLENWVDSRNRATIRWLRHLGFVIHPARPIGLRGVPFHRFELGAL